MTYIGYGPQVKVAQFLAFVNRVLSWLIWMTHVEKLGQETSTRNLHRIERSSTRCNFLVRETTVLLNTADQSNRTILVTCIDVSFWYKFLKQFSWACVTPINNLNFASYFDLFSDFLCIVAFAQNYFGNGLLCADVPLRNYSLTHSLNHS